MLIANRLIRPASEHGLAGWLETDFVCDRQGRRFLPNWHRHNRVRVHFSQLEAWYRTLDQLLAAKEQIELALYHRLRDLFSFKRDLMLYDITSTYFESAGPANFAKHGYIRDGKPHNVQVIVGVVMVAWLADRSSRLGRQHRGPQHGARGRTRFAPTISVQPHSVRR